MLFQKLHFYSFVLLPLYHLSTKLFNIWTFTWKNKDKILYALWTNKQQILYQILHNIKDKRSIILVNLVISLAHRPIFNFYIYILGALMFLSGIFYAVLRLNALSYLYSYKWSSKRFLLDILIAMLLFVISYYVIGVIFFIILISSHSALNALVFF